MVTKVCIDDFAIRKRHTHGTIMVGMESRRVINLFPLREIEDDVKWLKTYPNLSIVSKDALSPTILQSAGLILLLCRSETDSIC